MAGTNGFERRRVAVTGLGVVAPVGIGLDAFWENLLAGRSGIERLDYLVEDDRHRVVIGGQVSDFEPGDWLSESDVTRVDRFVQLGIVAARMAVEDAEFEPDDPSRVATSFGTAVAGMGTFSREILRLAEGGPKVVSPYTMPGGIPNMVAGYVSERCGFGGPSLCPASACSSSAHAIGWGYRLIRDGYADACLAGGSESPLDSVCVASMANLRALSTRNDDPHGASRPFDAGRDGFILAEGGAALMLEPLDQALARGAKVYAEVCGYGEASDAFHATRPHPEGDGAVRAIEAALAEAELEPSAVDYVNAHGTSTPLSDAIETKALHRSLGDTAKRIPISSTKSMTGHLIGAAGALESAATVMTIRDGWIPPTINYETPDPECDLDYVPNEKRQADIDVALCNSMGFGGHNVVVVFRRV
ncbi:MAG: beta-ketoacyl-ACP synthase II [Actinomycetota bacterium]|nr:beta-ketoacyl-ACP synthase II [Actinomycetota bacterium]